MFKTHVFKLVQKAKSSGGDKYVSETNENFNIYFPQDISRTDGKVHEKLKITVEVED